MSQPASAEVIVIGAGLAGLSAAVYLGRAKRDALVIHSGKSMARWEPDVQNYLGFPRGIPGGRLLSLAREQVRRYRVRFSRDEILSARRSGNGLFRLRGHRRSYTCQRLLIATGIFHIPPDIPGVKPCLGHSMFFCKDCDGYRVQGRSVAIYGWTNEAVEYALSLLVYSHCVAIVTDGREPRWDGVHEAWVEEYEIPVYRQEIRNTGRNGCHLTRLEFADGLDLEAASLFTTRGDIYLNKLARGLGASLDEEGQIIVGVDMQTNVEGLYAAGCVTPANCQMIIAAGEGASAAQAINRDLFEESLRSHSLRRFRIRQLRERRTRPIVRRRARSSSLRSGG